jgi:hypothetical protein
MVRSVRVLRWKLSSVTAWDESCQLVYLLRTAAYIRLAGSEQAGRQRSDRTKMGWNNGASSNQLYRTEASRLLTGAPADRSRGKFAERQG